ncbi:carboxylesterase/lipase family protein [Microbulbifer sp. GL-2]|uniref:carboxylesterase/lipase family protein n=1 Tax=Microbulbifer sp. GL-2 TaxID=2591606 RepID=UPI0011648674|nr:carboxylesterase family protein [Microbulbifer sp. GL-2]BBM02444.1 para-nitrobenzyl esterase [Microbulbifer sp. GL-2]
MDTAPGIGKHRNEKITPVIDTPAGPIFGEIDSESGTYKFLGIPYARPPIGELRWKPPEETPAWSSPFFADKFGMPAAQNSSALMEVRGQNGEVPDREECLYLNIFSPPITPNHKLPVMLWIHGGAFYMGSGCQDIYNGRHLASSNRAIIVTFNYRLGALGFLRLKDVSDLPSTGNEGLLDQIAALKWVKKNISAFGGNAENITLFGESAGAMSIISLLEMSDYRTLYSRAIIQSGHPGATHSIPRANNMALAFLEHLDKICKGKPIKNCPTKSLLQAQKEIINDPRMSKTWGQLPFKPVIDNKILKNKSSTSSRPHIEIKHKLLLGSNLEEWNLFSVTNPESYDLNYQKICKNLEWLLQENTLKPIIKFYYHKASKYKSSPWSEWSKTWNLMLTDMVFTLPGLRYLEKYQGESYHYHFTQPLASQPLLGACHAAEVAYVFGTHGEASLKELYRSEKEPHTLSKSMQEAWLNFAEDGNPGHTWTIFAEKYSQCIGSHPHLTNFNAEELLSLWQDIPNQVLNQYL